MPAPQDLQDYCHPGIVGNITTMSRSPESVSAADANRRFSELLRKVREGRSVVVTSHGRPVAKIVPITESDPVAQGARSALFARLRAERVTHVGRWTRDELYDDEP
jgi:prevent-host-death family protein